MKLVQRSPLALCFSQAASSFRSFIVLQAHFITSVERAAGCAPTNAGSPHHRIIEAPISNPSIQHALCVDFNNTRYQQAHRARSKARLAGPYFPQYRAEVDQAGLAFLELGICRQQPISKSVSSRTIGTLLYAER